MVTMRPLRHFPSRKDFSFFSFFVVLLLCTPNIFPLEIFSSSSFASMDQIFFLLLTLSFFSFSFIFSFAQQIFSFFKHLPPFPSLFSLSSDEQKLYPYHRFKIFGFHNQQKVSLIPWQNCFDNTCMFQIFSEVKTILQQRSYFLAIWLCWLKHNTASSNSPVSVYYDLDPISQFWPDLIALDNFIFWYCRSKILHCFPLSCPSLTGATS